MVQLKKILNNKYKLKFDNVLNILNYQNIQ